MKQDLDRLMEQHGLDAIVVSGKLNGNPALYYIANGAQVIRGHVIKKKGDAPLFLCSPIDREVAEAGGLEVVTTNRYDYEGILRENPDLLAAAVELYRRIFADLGIRGRVGFYGMADQGSAWRLLTALNEQLPEVQVYGDYEPTLIDQARSTKDAGEVERIRDVGRRTEVVFAQTVEFLKSHRVQGETLVQVDGTPLTIGRVHREISRFLSEQALDVPESIIFAIGRDAAIPHNKGNPTDLVTLGRTIIFDMGTREINGGYYFDMTRTFCLGYAPPEVEAVYENVRNCGNMLVGAYRVGATTRSFMQMACDYFEDRGYPTLSSDTTTQVGFPHGLGHGIGLAVHEDPFFSLAPANQQVLQVGHVFTCEPGLYFPEKGYGVRIEDVVWLAPDGTVQDLTRFPKELVIPI